MTTTTRILLDSSTIDTLLLEDGPEDRLRSVAQLARMDDTVREIRRWEEVDAHEDELVRRWELERELGGEG